jgi:hypothetical protein
MDEVIFKVGQYYRDDFDEEIIRIDSIEGSSIHYTITERPHNPSLVGDKEHNHIDIMTETYRHLPAYGSPLWKVLYG